MKLDVSPQGALFYCSVLATFFVLAVYIWKPIYDPPSFGKLEPRKQTLNRDRTEGRLKRENTQKQQEFEIKMRCQSVGTLCFLAMLYFILVADHSRRPDVSIAAWFGLKIDLQVILFTLKALMLNSVLFAGEILQLATGMTRVHHKPGIETFKNLVVAPLFEEFIYRVCMINLMVESQSLDEVRSVLVLPLFFAASHLHHEIFI
jgi:hypothetical protein